MASTLYVGASFDTLQTLKNTCKDYAIQHAFEYRVLKANKSRYTIECKAEGCTWRLHASLVHGSSICRIKTYESQHTCFGINHSGHTQASHGFLAQKIADKVRKQPSYHPVDIIRDVQREMGIKVSYSTAYRTKERANEINNGTHDAAYRSLPKYCQDLVNSNVNSTAILEKTPEDKFHRLFISYGAAATGFKYCCPLLGLDGTHLKHKYQAIGVDANGSLFLIAYSVVDAENDSNWLWFLECLRNVLQAHTTHLFGPENLVFLSDQQKGLIQAVEQLFPDSPHGFCLRHLEDNMHHLFKNTELKSLLWKAAHATMETVFNQALIDMRSINPVCVDWLLQTANPEHWAELYFKGKRYGHLISNIAEAFNVKLMEAHEMPILAMLEEIRQQLMGWFASRRQLENNTAGTIVSGVQLQIQKLINERVSGTRS